MVKVSREDAAAGRDARIAAAQELLAGEVAALQSGEDWKRYLEFSVRLHDYSPSNVMLVVAQYARLQAEGLVGGGELGYVAGFHSWRALGRSVSKGQRGMVVLAPVRYREAVDGEGASRRLGRGERPAPGESESVRVRGFTVEHVFAVSQTHGAELPEPPRPQILSGEAPGGLGSAVMGLVESCGFSVGTVDSAEALGGANGLTDWGSKKVLVRADMDDAAMVRTLIHEAAHVILHAGPPGQFLPRQRKEVEAESVAFVVSAVHGMAAGDYSFPYVAGWAGGDGAKAVAATQVRVAKAVKEILAVSAAEQSAGGRVPGVDAALEAARVERANCEARRVVADGRSASPAGIGVS